MVSGLNVNFYKSKVVGVGCGEEAVAITAEKLNCKIMRIPFVYLGVDVELIREGQQLRSQLYRNCRKC